MNDSCSIPETRRIKIEQMNIKTIQRNNKDERKISEVKKPQTHRRST